MHLLKGGSPGNVTVGVGNTDVGVGDTDVAITVRVVPSRVNKVAKLMTVK